MRIAILVLVAAGLLSQGCGQPHSIYADRVAEPAAVAAANGGKPRYVGLWAANAAQCRTHAWIFTTKRLVGPAGAAACDIVGPDASPAGYSASSICTIGASQPRSGRVVMTLVGPAAGESMTLSQGPFDPPVSLVRCAV